MSAVVDLMSIALTHAMKSDLYQVCLQGEQSKIQEVHPFYALLSLFLQLKLLNEN